MIRFSEFVSLGHPDKVADYISSYLLDRYIEVDPDTCYAVEVQIKDNHVTLGGEVSSKLELSPSQLVFYVRKAVNEIGYTKDYAKKWGNKNAICGDALVVDSFIRQQSKDIAKGLSGWGDQGIFYGMAEPNEDGMPEDHALAKRLCKELFECGIGGLDIKTQVVMDNGDLKKLIVAIPLLNNDAHKEVENFIKERVPGDYELIINGTGRYVQHSSCADCGTTGRKLVVDFYGGNCKIGGGSPWTKDASKADLTLNLLARKLAKDQAKKLGKTIYVSLACCIGKQDVDICIQDKDGNIIKEGTITISPSELKEKFKLNKPIFASMCRWGVFGEFQRDKEWEK